MSGELLAGLYCGPAPEPAGIWLRWNLDPVLLLGLGLLALTVGRTRPGALAVGVLVVAFVSPLCALSAALFSARVVHHVLLVAVAAPLLALAWPARRTLPKMPAFLVSTLVLWGWHLPEAYDLALSNVAVYWAMQISLLASAVLFWKAALNPGGAPGQGLFLVLAGYMQMAFLGALLSFAPESLYAAHAVAPLAWGFSPLSDQQLGGLVMWVPAGLPFVVFGAWMARRSWRSLEERPA